MIDIQKKGALFVLVPLLILGLSVTACENTEELVDPSFATGTVVIDISPDDIDAPWELILPDGSTVGGNGDTALRDLAPGSYQLNFGAVPGYGSPTPRSQTLEAGDELRLTGTYVARSAPTGSVDINPDPDEIGAGWFLAVDGKFAARGAGDSTLTEVSAGEVQLIWNPVEGWASPVPNPAVQLLEADSLITFAGTYTPLPDGDLGWIVVRPLPEGIEAPWTLSGPQAAGGVGAFQLPGVPVGEYTIEWGEVSGYRTPRPSVGTLTAQQILEFETVYEPATGTITIDPTPNEINAPWTLTPSQGEPFNGNGDTTLRDLPVGQYTLTWKAVSGWLQPDPAEETIFLSIDETRLITGTYEPAPPASGTIVIHASPAEAPWSLTGPEFSTNGTGSATFPAVTPGDYTILWREISGWNLPSPSEQTRTLEAGDSVTFIGSYSNPNGPAINDATGQFRASGTVSISGENFGSHTLDITSGVGPDGWIERNALSTPVDALSGAGGWGQGFSNAVPAFIDDTRVRTGSRSINASVGRTADGDWQKPVTYHKPETFDKVFISWWVYFEPKVWAEDSQWKIWYVSPSDYHSHCAALSCVSRWNTSLSPYTYGTALFGCLGTGGGAECAQDIIPDPYYEPRYGDPGMYQSHNHAGSEPFSVNLPNIGQWARWDLYLDASDVNVSNGEFEYYITKASGRKQTDKWTGLQTHRSACSHMGQPPADPWRYFGLQGMWDDSPIGEPQITNDAADFFYDDIYIQFGTRARVELGDASSYAACKKLEIQTPTAWNEGPGEDSITVTFNSGTFTSGQTAYLFVVDASGEASPGFRITIE